MLEQEKEALGFLISVHPLEFYTGALKKMAYVHAKDLPRLVGKMVSIAGWLVIGKTVHTKEGDPMKFITFEDPTGIYETVFFPKVYHQYCHLLNAERPYIIKGRVEEDFGAVTVTVLRMEFIRIG